MKKLLVLALSGIGDALMFTPALIVLKRAEPELEIDAVVMFKAVEEMYSNTGLFSRVIHFDFLKEGALNSLLFVIGLRGKYTHSVSVYPSNRKEYNIISALIGAKNRGGVKYLRSDIDNLGFFNNIRVQESDSQHNAVTNIDLIKKLFAIESADQPPYYFPINSSNSDFAQDFIQKSKLERHRPIIGMHPGCNTLKNHINRRWAPENFAKLADILASKFNSQNILFGGPEESDLRKQVIAAANSPILESNARSLPDSAALIKACTIFITNDSSLMHVSSAMGVPVVAIIGPTNKLYIHPWKTKYAIASLNLECAPCFYYTPKPLKCSRTDTQYKCVKELTPEQVFLEVSKLFENLNT